MSGAEATTQGGDSDEGQVEVKVRGGLKGGGQGQQAVPSWGDLQSFDDP